MQANLIMGGGPHMRIWVLGEGAGRWSFIISSLIKPTLCFHPEGRGRRGRSGVGKGGEGRGEEIGEDIEVVKF